MSLTKTKKAEVALKNEYNELQQKLEEKEMQGAVDKPGSAHVALYIIFPVLLSFFFFLKPC